ncbi:NUDIX hydrolase [Halalkalicoccus tibetensis]|uniref:NUDIX hydrolase n=1 Tax=Halalkalicoccus tibetensis TaxID=175632 RepID=A0ABD5V1U4_9EURY
MSDPDADWEVLESVTEYETGWYTGGYDLVEQPDGSEKKYYWAELAPAAVVVASTGEEVVFVEQYRPAIGQTHLELPAGIIEDGESATEAGARELREETGFEADGVSLLQRMWVATGAMRHERAIVFAEGLTPTEQELDDNEFLTVRSVPVEEALERGREEPTNDATVEGLLLAREEGLL